MHLQIGTELVLPSLKSYRGMPRLPVPRPGRATPAASAAASTFVKRVRRWLLLRGQHHERVAATSPASSDGTGC